MRPEFGDLIEAIQRTGSVSEAKSVLQASIERLGFTQLDYGAGRLRSAIGSAPPVFQMDMHLATNDWTARYIEMGYQRVDRSMRKSLTQSTPWIYSEVMAQPPENTLQQQMEEDVRTFVSSGLALPLHASGRTGVLHLGSQLSSAEFLQLDREIRPLAALLGAYFHEHITRLTAQEPPPVVLTVRERECLVWASAGKTAWETAAILCLSESTVREHMANAMRKLDVRTRAQAVARALSLGLIAP